MEQRKEINCFVMGRWGVKIMIVQSILVSVLGDLFFLGVVSLSLLVGRFEEEYIIFGMLVCGV